MKCKIAVIDLSENNYNAVKFIAIFKLMAIILYTGIVGLYRNAGRVGLYIKDLITYSVILYIDINIDLA